MRELLSASIKMLYRDKQALFWALVFPLTFTVVFALFDFDGGPDVRIAIVAEESSAVAEGLTSGLGRIDRFDLDERRDLDEARDELREGKLDLVVEVSQDPRPVVDLLFNRANVEINQVALPAVERIVDGMNLEMANVDAAIGFHRRPVAGRDIGYYDFLLPGLAAMGVMNFSILGVAVAIARFREQNILKRILATPLPPSRFLAAQVATRLVLALVQVAVILAVGVFVFGANIYGNVALLFALATLANLVFLNIGFALARRSRNADAAQGLANAVALPMMFLAGVFFPVETLPEILQSVVAWLPLTPLVEAMRKVALEAASITDLSREIALLTGWALVTFLLARRTFRFAPG